MSVRAKRVYEPPAPEDGRRYLIDRLWPRGLSKVTLRLDAWLKDLAPSSELCVWFGHEPGRFLDFRRRYRAELRQRPDLLDRLVTEVRSQNVTLLFAARDVVHSNAAVLREAVEERVLRRGKQRPPDSRSPRSLAPLRRPTPPAHGSPPATGRRTRSHRG